MKSKYKILTFLFVSLFFSHNAISDSFESWKDIDSYYNKKKIDIYSLQDSDLEKLKIIKSIPKDFALLENVTKKKEIFYFITYPIIYKNNKDIQIERRVVLDIEKRYKKKIIEEDDIQDLKKLSKKYKLETDIIDKTLFKKLKQRINVIPISLALGQAIIESGWGQSRFAIEGNAIYGQWTFNAKQGLIPKKRDPDKNHTVKKFETLSESVKSYMYNINTHPAYFDFRIVRRITTLMGITKAAVSYKMQELAAYAEIGQEYVDKLELIVESNDLVKFDKFN